MGMACHAVRAAGGISYIGVSKEEVGESKDGVSDDLWRWRCGQHLDDDGGEPCRVCRGVGRIEGDGYGFGGKLVW